MYSNLRAFVNLISTSLCSRLSSSSSTCALRLCGWLLVHSVQGPLELISRGAGQKLTHTTLEGALPRLQVLRGLWHLHVGIEFFYLVEDCVLVIIFEVIITLLRHVMTG